MIFSRAATAPSRRRAHAAMGAQEARRGVFQDDSLPAHAHLARSAVSVIHDFGGHLFRQMQQICRVSAGSLNARSITTGQRFGN